MVVREAESIALARFLIHRPLRVSCALARVEVIRAVRAHAPAAVLRARQAIERIDLLRLDDELLDAAAEIAPVFRGSDGVRGYPLRMRSLDAIHLAAAQTLGSTLAELITYDVRMARAARAVGLTVVAPGSQV